MRSYNSNDDNIRSLIIAILVLFLLGIALSFVSEWVGRYNEKMKMERIEGELPIGVFIHPRYVVSDADTVTKTYTYILDDYKIISGIASYYADRFHGKVTANGEIYDMYSLTVAHRELAFNSLLRITNMNNGKVVIARVNDRGPYIFSREIDLSLAVAGELDMVWDGLAMVKIEVIGRVGSSRYGEGVI